jgi:hypothetical protein
MSIPYVRAVRAFAAQGTTSAQALLLPTTMSISDSHLNSSLALRVPSLQANPSDRASMASSDWLGRSLDIAKAATSASEIVPFPYVKTIASVIVQLLEIVQVRNLSHRRSWKGRFADLHRRMSLGITTTSGTL